MSGGRESIWEYNAPQYVDFTKVDNQDLGADEYFGK